MNIASIKVYVCVVRMYFFTIDDDFGTEIEFVAVYKGHGLECGEENEEPPKIHFSHIKTRKFLGN